MAKLVPSNDPTNVYFVIADLDRHPGQLAASDKRGRLWFYCIEHNFIYWPRDCCQPCADRAAEVKQGPSGPGVQPLHTPAKVP